MRCLSESAHWDGRGGGGRGGRKGGTDGRRNNAEVRRLLVESTVVNQDDG